VLSSLILLSKNDRKTLEKFEKEFIYSFFLFAFICLSNIYYFGGDYRDFDSYSRFILVIPIFYYVRNSNLSFNWIIFGICLAAIIFGINKILMVFFGLNIVPFVKSYGFVSFYGAIFGLTALFFLNKKRRMSSIILFLFSGYLGFLTSFLAGGRGVWIASIISLLILFVLNPAKWNRLEKLFIPFLFFIAFISSLAIPQSGMSDRMKLAIDGAKEYITNYDKNVDTSKGLSATTRLEMWRSAIHISKENLLFGVGENNYKKHTLDLINQGVIGDYIKQYNHPHGQYLSTLVQQGLVGLFSLLWLFYVPIKAAMLSYWDDQENNENVNNIRSMIIIVSFYYIFYSLTNGVFDHQNTTLFYAYSIAILLGFLKKEKDLISN